MKLEDETSLKKIGQGRSGTVYYDGEAVKVFNDGDLPAKIVNYFLKGAPNAYRWNKHAANCTTIRRDILSVLVPYWLDDKVRVAPSSGITWNDEAKGYELRTEYIDGRPVALHHPFSKYTDWELSDLVHEVMEPLQDHLIDSGFDGLVWQVGKGNPLALDNFLLDNKGGWVWIDAESGVPALFPLNPIPLISYYIPKSIKHGTPLFDNVDINKLFSYLENHKPSLESKIGESEYEQLIQNSKQLEVNQTKWTSMKRAQRSIAYNLKRGKLSEEQAEWYSNHVFSWYKDQSINLSGKALKKISYELPKKLFEKLSSIEYKQSLRNFAKFVVKSDYRSQTIRNMVANRLDQWEERKQMSPEQTEYLRNQLDDENVSPYLTDFLAHTLLKIPGKVIELGILPALQLSGSIDIETFIWAELFTGSVLRTGYTLTRMGVDALKPTNMQELPDIAKNYLSELRKTKDEKGYLGALKYSGKSFLHIPRMVALGVGMIPGIGVIPSPGSAAYPVQMVYTATADDKELSEFILYDTAARIGSKFPIWSGKDTRVEHFFNHIPDVIIKNRNNLNAMAKST